MQLRTKTYISNCCESERFIESYACFCVCLIVHSLNENFVNHVHSYFIHRDCFSLDYVN